MPANLLRSKSKGILSFVEGYCLRLFLSLVRFAPKRIRKCLMIISLRLYWRFYVYLKLIISAYHNGTSPKHIYDWGIHSFFMKHISEGMTVLDIGCGEGLLTKKISQKAGKVIAYDINLRSIETARKINSADNIEYFVGDALECLQQGKYDVVILSSILTFVNDQESFLNKLHEVADTLLIRETRYDNDYTVLLSREFGIRKSLYYEYTKEELEQKLRETGWEVVNSWDTYDIFLNAKSMLSGGHQNP